jgi:hypothetical protein
MQDHWTPAQIVTAVLGILGFLLSCYNYLIVQARKDRDDRQSRLADIRFRFGQQRQQAMELMMGAQIAALRKNQRLTDIQNQAAQAGLRASADLLQKPVKQTEAELSELESQMKILLPDNLAPDATPEEIQKREESYGKIILGLKSGVPGQEAESLKVDEIVEIVKAEIAKHTGQVP